MSANVDDEITLSPAEWERIECRVEAFRQALAHEMLMSKMLGAIEQQERELHRMNRRLAA